MDLNYIMSTKQIFFFKKSSMDPNKQLIIGITQKRKRKISS